MIQRLKFGYLIEMQLQSEELRMWRTVVKVTGCVQLNVNINQGSN